MGASMTSQDGDQGNGDEGRFGNGASLVLGVAALLAGADLLNQQGWLSGGSKATPPKKAVGSKASTKKKTEKTGSCTSRSAYQTFVSQRMVHYRAKGVSPQLAMSKAAKDWREQKQN